MKTISGTVDVVMPHVVLQVVVAFCANYAGAALLTWATIAVGIGIIAAVVDVCERDPSDRWEP